MYFETIFEKAFACQFLGIGVHVAQMFFFSREFKRNNKIQIWFTEHVEVKGSEK